MTTESPNYSNSVHKLLRGLRKNVPEFTEDDYKQRVPRSGRVCTNVRPIYSEPVIRFCPKYGCIYKRKIIGHVHDFLDLQTLKLTQVYQKNAYDGFWDVYDGPFKPSLSERGTLEEDVSEDGAAAGEPNNMDYGKNKIREKITPKQLDIHAYDQPKLNRKRVYDQIPSKDKPKNYHSNSFQLEKSTGQSKSKAESIQLASSRANYDRYVDQRPIKANLELLTSISPSMDNSDWAQKFSQPKLVHLAISWEYNDKKSDDSKKNQDQTKDMITTELDSFQLFPDDQPKRRGDIDHSIGKAELLQPSVTKVIGDDHSDLCKTTNDITQVINTTNLQDPSDNGLTKNGHIDAFKNKDDIDNEVNIADLLKPAFIGQLTEDFSDKTEIRVYVENKDEFLQQSSIGQLIEDHSDNTKIRDNIHNDGKIDDLLPQAFTRHIVKDPSGETKIRADMEIVQNKTELIQLATNRILHNDHSDVSKSRDDVVQVANKTTPVELPYHLGIVDINKEPPKTDIKSLISFENEVVCPDEPNNDQTNTSKTGYDVDKVDKKETNEFQTPKESDAKGLHAKSESKYEHFTMRNKDINESETLFQIEVSDCSECHIFDSLHFKEEVVGENVLITQVKHDRASLNSDTCQTDNAKRLKNETETVVRDIAEDQNIVSYIAENHISEIPNLQEQILGDDAPVTNVKEYDLNYYNDETSTVVSDNDILRSDIITRSDSKIDEHPIEYKDTGQDENSEFMMGILGIYARGQQHYIIDNASTQRIDDDDDDEDDLMSGVFGIFTRGC